jgi:hypothetical protein
MISFRCSLNNEKCNLMIRFRKKEKRYSNVLLKL